jgi:hypothetical protein
MCVCEAILIYRLIFCLMLKLKVMGEMKYISQMIEDGSFDNEFKPLYEKAYQNDEPIFTYAGTKYAVSYARNIIEFVDDFRSDIKMLKKFEK